MEVVQDLSIRTPASTTKYRTQGWFIYLFFPHREWGYMCYSTHVKVRGELHGVSSLLLSLCGFQNSNSSHQTYMVGTFTN